MASMQLDWSSADVSDGRLKVGFREKAPKKWREELARAAMLLSHDTWELTVKGRHVRVSPVRLGEEERVKHFLESAVLEANSKMKGDEGELFEPEPADDPEHEDETADARPDEELTARFRAFG